MTNVQHTPGPWRFDTKMNPPQIRGPEGYGNSSGLTLAIPHKNPGLPCEQWEANARLIAAAPELLSALELAWQLIQQSGMSVDDRPGSSFDVIRAAIAKAKGGAA